MKHPREYDGTRVVPVVGVLTFLCLVGIVWATWPLSAVRTTVVSICLFGWMEGFRWMIRGSESSSDPEVKR